LFGVLIPVAAGASIFSSLPNPVSTGVPELQKRKNDYFWVLTRREQKWKALATSPEPVASNTCDAAGEYMESRQEEIRTTGRVGEEKRIKKSEPTARRGGGRGLAVTRRSLLR
jgi:hypothetical protein